jgi:hypothetical protein
MRRQIEHGKLDVVDLPSPTVTPFVLALGIALIVTALVTNAYIGLLGLVLALWASVGWFSGAASRKNTVLPRFAPKRLRSSPHEH